MRFRWPRYLPRFPAILLLPTVVTAWALLWVHYENEWLGWTSNFPLEFYVVDLNYSNPDLGWSILNVRNFLVATTVALAAGWIATRLRTQTPARPAPRRRRGTAARGLGGGGASCYLPLRFGFFVQGSFFLSTRPPA